MSKHTQQVPAANDSLTPLQQALLDRADSIMDSLSATVSKASAFASDQIPDIAFQYVAYGRASLTTYMCLGITLFCIGMWLCIRVALQDVYKQGTIKTYWGLEWCQPRQFAMGSGVVATVVGAVVSLVNLSNVIMVWFAPKVWLINEIARLVKR
jgi:hypothetical protein